MENIKNVNEKENVKKVIKSFEVITKKSEKTGNEYYLLEVTTHKGNKSQIFLSESQKAIIDEVGITNCSVNIETRHSDAKKKDYDVIAFHVADELVFDFFPKDRAFIVLAKLQAK